MFVIFVLLFGVFPNNSEVMARPGFHPDSPSVTAWHALPNQGFLYNGVGTLIVSGNSLYVGGSFRETGDGTLKNLGYIARGSFSNLLNNNVYFPQVMR